MERDLSRLGERTDHQQQARGDEGAVIAGEDLRGLVEDRQEVDAAGRAEQQDRAEHEADVAEALTVNPEEWRAELPLIEEWFDFIGEKLPTSLRDEFDSLKQRLADADRG